MNNRARITLVSFLAYFVMSGLLAPIGIVSGPMAEALNLTVVEVTSGFTWLTFGILAGAILALFVFEWLPLKTLLLLLFAGIGGTLAFLSRQSEAALIWYSLGLVGLCTGIALAAAALTITRTYDADRRASMLVITDSWFSVAGVITSWVAIYLLGKSFHWSGSYLFIALIAVTVFGLVLGSKFPDASPPQEERGVRTPWPLNVWLCVAALFLYTLGQNSMLWWLPNYVQTHLAVAPDQAGSLVGQYWIGMFVAQLFVAWWVLKVGTKRVIGIGAITVTAFSIPLWTVSDPDALFVLATVWGFANLGMLKMVLSFATYMVPTPTPKLVSSLLLGASLGTAVSPWVTSQIVAATSNHFILQFSTLCYVGLSVLVFTAISRSKKIAL